MNNDLKNRVMALIGAILISIGLFILFAPAKAEAQNGYQQFISRDEVCMDMAGAASTIAIYRDDGVSPAQFARAMIKKYNNNIIDYQMLDNVSNIALLVYRDYAHLTPAQASVEIYRVCMEVDI